METLIVNSIRIHCILDNENTNTITSTGLGHRVKGFQHTTPLLACIKTAFKNPQCSNVAINIKLFKGTTVYIFQLTAKHINV